jgi:hypothetical protein
VKRRPHTVFLAVCVLLVIGFGCKDEITNSGVSDVVFKPSQIRYAEVDLFLNQACSYYPCHCYESPGGAPNFTTYYDVMTSYGKLKKVVVPRDSLGSAMYVSMREKDPQKMMMPPKEKPRPTENQIKGIGTWIMEGALESY